jgi:hypothetical protein
VVIDDIHVGSLRLPDRCSCRYREVSSKEPGDHPQTSYVAIAVGGLSDFPNITVNLTTP